MRLATGSSPLGTYKQLIEWYEKGDIDFSKVTSVNLDEYVVDLHESTIKANYVKLGNRKL